MNRDHKSSPSLQPSLPGDGDSRDRPEHSRLRGSRGGHLGAAVFAVWLAWGCATNSFSQTDAVARASLLETQGHFAKASQVLGKALDQKGLSSENRFQLEFERDRLRRIQLDYPLTQSELYSELKKSVSKLTQQEFETWVLEGRFDSRDIDGHKLFMTASVSNLFFRYPELDPRRLPLKNSAAVETRRLETCIEIKKQVAAEKRPYVLQKKFRVTMEVSANANAAPEGQTIRAWLPIPRQYPFQSSFVLVSSAPEAKHIDAPSSPARSIYLEQTAHQGKPTAFKAQYEYQTQGVWFDLQPEKTRPADLSDPELKSFTSETAHVQFTPEMRALSDRIGGRETNACIKAKRFYDWISENIKYSFATEYSTIRNISEYCRAHGYGDCGQEALLFITLCRLNGIPARWQSGWTIFPGAKSNHDWTEIYLAPYGWVPVDPYMGIYATRYASSLASPQRKELKDFYFGGLDQYRLIANGDHNQPLNPPKRTMRSDDVDFQRGELEWGDHNIYFDQFSYELSAEELPIPPSKVE